MFVSFPTSSAPNRGIFLFLQLSSEVLDFKFSSQNLIVCYPKYHQVPGTRYQVLCCYRSSQYSYTTTEVTHGRTARFVPGVPGAVIYS